MANTFTIHSDELNTFIAEEREKVLAYLRKTFAVRDDDIYDIYQEAAMALFLNIRDGKLSNLSSTLSTYFLRICINQTLKFISKTRKIVPLFDENRLTEPDAFMAEKIDELYQICVENEAADKQLRLEKLVERIIETIPSTCKNVLKGYYWDNLSTVTIADLYGFSNASSVKTQKYKCIQKFRNKYNELIDKIYG